MRHRNSGVKLYCTSSHRKAMFQNMANSLFEHELIKTTVPKAKELRRVAEPLITLAKNDTVANRRLAFARTRSAATVGKLFTVLGIVTKNVTAVIYVFLKLVSVQVMLRRWLM